MGLLIDMISVGQGDSFLLTVDGQAGEAYVLIDAGQPDAGPKVLNYLNQFAPTGLDMVIATHIDSDYVGGLASVLTHATLKRNATFLLNVSAFKECLRLSTLQKPSRRLPISAE